MTTAATSLLGLALPVTGELTGTWGDTVNNSITNLLDAAVAGTTTLSTDADVTLTTTTLAANQARQAVLLFSGARTALRTVTAPAQSKIYTVINATTGGFSVKLVGAGPTTGLTIPAGASAVVAWNGSDFVEIGSTTLNSLTVSGNLSVAGTTTLTGAATLTANPTLSGGTANGVAYLNGSKVLTTGSALVFDGSNLGLGVTPSAWRSLYNRALQVGDTGVSFSSGTSALSSDQYMYICNNGYVDSTGAWVYTRSKPSIRYEGFNGEHRWHTAPSGTAGNPISFTQAMTLTAGGNLGIGQTSPSQKLEVYASQSTPVIVKIQNDSASTSAGTKLVFGNYNNTDTAYLSDQFDGSTFNVRLWKPTPGYMSFGTDNTERARIDSSGNLLVGCTSITTPITSGGSGVVLRAAGQIYANDTYLNVNADGTIMQFRRSGSAVGSITVTTVATLYNTTSDYRLKTVIGPVSNAGQRIDALEPIEYEWKTDGSRTRGFLAHKFQEVYAGSVSGTKDAVDAEGNPVYQSMQAGSSEVIADLVAELQSLRQRLAAAGI